MDQITYSILDPTGNITALVESGVELGRQPELAAELMRRHPELEQVGFLRLTPDGEGVAAELRMAGGEFCGNASMCAAVRCVLEKETAGEESLLLRVSGAKAPVELRVQRRSFERFDTAVRMPPAPGIEEEDFSFEGLRGRLPYVRMQGIGHLIVTPDSVFYTLKEDRAAAERAVRAFCERLGAEGLGLQFLEGEAPACRMTPLVYIPGSGTVFWENSCASGSAAAGIYLASVQGAPLSLTLEQPGGSLRAKCDAQGEIWLHGSVRVVGRYRQEAGG